MGRPSGGRGGPGRIATCNEAAPAHANCQRFPRPTASVATLLEVSEDTVRTVLRAWGPGKFDAALLLDGKGFRPDGRTAATLIPPAFGLAGVNLHTWTGWGSVTHWNGFVANIEMHGKGTFYDPRLNDAARFPVAARAGFGNIRNTPDLVTPKLAGLSEAQKSDVVEYLKSL